MPAAAVLAALALAAQQPTDDGPVQTAPRERPAAELGETKVEIPPGAKPATEESAGPAAAAGAKSLAFEPKTFVDGDTLQIVLGQRALFRLDDKGLPVLAKVEQGKLADAHPAGEVTETFEKPAEGEIAVALDGSAEARATVLKVWNQTGKAVDYRAIALVMVKGKLTPAPAPTCAVPPRSVRVETWRRPIVAVGLGRFKESVATKACK
jgi:hypothetical protein